MGVLLFIYDMMVFITYVWPNNKITNIYVGNWFYPFTKYKCIFVHV